MLIDDFLTLNLQALYYCSNNFFIFIDHRMFLRDALADHQLEFNCPVKNLGIFALQTLDIMPIEIPAGECIHQFGCFDLFHFIFFL